MEELIKALELGKPTFDGEDVNYDVATIENTIKVIKKYAEIKKIVDDWNTADIVGDEQDKDRYFRKILDVFDDDCLHENTCESTVQGNCVWYTSDIRWTDKLSVTSNGDIIDFNGRVVGHINLMIGGAE